MPSNSILWNTKFLGRIYTPVAEITWITWPCFGENSELWLKFWNLVNILKFGQHLDIWYSLVWFGMSEEVYVIQNSQSVSQWVSQWVSDEGRYRAARAAKNLDKSFWWQWFTFLKPQKFLQDLGRAVHSVPWERMRRANLIL